MDDGCSPTVGILIFAGFVILDFVVFGFIAAMQNLNEAAIERLAGEEDRGARLLRRLLTDEMSDIRMSANCGGFNRAYAVSFWRVPLSGARIFCRKMREASCRYLWMSSLL